MKKSMLLTLLAAFGITLMSFVQDDSSEYKVRTDKSELQWIGRKMGGEHTGLVGLKSGSFTVKDSVITAGTFVIDMTSISVTDSESKKLLNHVKGVDFFNVDQFKESKLVITGSTKDGKDMLKVSGNLTIVGKTNPITFSAHRIGQTEHYLLYSAVIKIDRTKWGIEYRSSAVGDAFIDDVFDIKVKLTSEKVES